MSHLSAVDHDADLLPFLASSGRAEPSVQPAEAPRPVLAPPSVWATKRAFDVVLGIALLPVVGLVAAGLVVGNSILNPGPLVFRQLRMGRHGKPFTIYKFRTMRPGRRTMRGPEDPVETERITRLGAILRRTRVDELPQIINVLNGTMSFVGPRPDMYEHALSYLDSVPCYRRRTAVRPGITGFAQVTTGYAEGSAGAAQKARRDAIYIRRACWGLELAIMARTLGVIVTGRGAR